MTAFVRLSPLAKHAGIVLCVALAGCAAVPRLEPTALERADLQLASGNYRAAMNLYDDFLRASSYHPEARRVVATRAALERLLKVEDAIPELERQARLREDEASQARAELAELRAEIQRVRQELGRLRYVDVQRVNLQNKLTLCGEALAETQYQVRAVRAETTRVRENLERLKLMELDLEQRLR
jgi:tetratricopeptide (TPR) repeat protein